MTDNRLSEPTACECQQREVCVCSDDRGTWNISSWTPSPTSPLPAAAFSPFIVLLRKLARVTPASRPPVLDAGIPKPGHRGGWSAGVCHLLHLLARPRWGFHILKPNRSANDDFGNAPAREDSAEDSRKCLEVYRRFSFHSRRSASHLLDWKSWASDGFSFDSVIVECFGNLFVGSKFMW